MLMDTLGNDFHSTALSTSEHTKGSIACGKELYWPVKAKTVRKDQFTVERQEETGYGHE
jgi:hypothetical protein